MNELIEISLLMDFYGQLLTKRQYEIMDMYYNSNYSLAEIAENIDISRQAVHDSLKKAKATLIEFENKLKLIERFFKNRNTLQDILEKIDSLDTCEWKEIDRVTINNIKQEINSLVKEM